MTPALLYLSAPRATFVPFRGFDGNPTGMVNAANVQTVEQMAASIGTGKDPLGSTDLDMKAGALVGGAIGTIFPVVGTAVGTIAGTGIGAIVGFVDRTLGEGAAIGTLVFPGIGTAVGYFFDKVLGLLSQDPPFKTQAGQFAQRIDGGDQTGLSDLIAKIAQVKLDRNDTRSDKLAALQGVLDTYNSVMSKAKTQAWGGDPNVFLAQFVALEKVIADIATVYWQSPAGIASWQADPNDLSGVGKLTKAALDRIEMLQALYVQEAATPAGIANAQAGRVVSAPFDVVFDGGAAGSGGAAGGGWGAVIAGAGAGALAGGPVGAALGAIVGAIISRRS